MEGLLFLFIPMAYYGGAQLLTSLLFSIPISRLLYHPVETQDTQQWNAKKITTLRIWCLIWGAMAIASFVYGYLDGLLDFRIRYPVARGVTWFTYFFAPLPFQLAVGIFMSRHFRNRRSYAVVTHLMGLALLGTAVVAFMILLPTVLPSWDFRLKKARGYQLFATPELEAPMTYAFLVGLLVLGVSWISALKRTSVSRNVD